VELDFRADALWLRVRDNGPGAAAGAGGHGLLGMRERVATVGGTLRIGSAATGFIIEAVLPTRSPEATGW
jgi:signal transduction histidine kinase